MVTGYIQFQGEGGVITIEASIEEVDAAPGVIKAGVGDKIRSTVAAAQTGFEDAMKGVLTYSARVITEAMDELDHPPDQLEVTFGLKATGEVGNFAITKLGGEANYSVKLTWNDLAR